MLVAGGDGLATETRGRKFKDTQAVAHVRASAAGEDLVEGRSTEVGETVVLEEKCAGGATGLNTFTGLGEVECGVLEGGGRIGGEDLADGGDVDGEG